MFNRRLTVSNVMTYDKLDLDLTSFDGKVVAITGENGAGKTTLMELLGFTSLYREFPTRGKALDKYCHGKKASIESEFEFGGKIYTTRITINPANGRMESYLIDSGEIVNKDGKKDSFLEAVIKRFGPKQLALSSIFSAQDAKGSFLSLERADRKDLFINMLNLGILQKVSKFSGGIEDQEGAREKELQIKIDTLKDACEAAIPDQEYLSEQKRLIEIEIENLEAQLSQLKAALAAAQQEEASRKERSERRSVVDRQLRDIYARGKKNKEKLESLQVELKTTESSLDESRLPELRNQVAQVGELEMEEKSCRVRLQELTLEQTEYDRVKTDLESKMRLIGQELGHLRTKRTAAEKAAEGLKVLPCGGEGQYSACPLIQNSVTQRDGIANLEQEISQKEKEWDQLRDRVDYQITPPDPVESDAIIERLGQIEVTLKHVRQAPIKIKEIEGAKDKISGLGDSIHQLEETLEQQRQEACFKKAELEELGEAIVTSAETHAWELTKKIGLVSGEIRQSKEDLHNIIMELGKVDIIKANVESAQLLRQKYELEQHMIQKDKRQWAHLSYAFGASCIQSIEIDSAGPAVSGIINDLLMSCFGNRFTVNIITQVERADRSGMKDCFDLQIIDSEKNRTAMVNDLSGGERVIIGEAVSLAISLYNYQVGSIKWDTLYRDECAGALDQQNSHRYISMLRRVINLGNFKRCFFIAHQTNLCDMSDNRIYISNGRVCIN